jgi:hypothetical protein
MTIYKVERTEKTKDFSESVFVETIGGIYVESPNIGFFKHPTITTPEQLKKHLENLKKEGFKIRKSVKIARA